MSSFVPTGKIILIKNVDIDSTYTHQYYFTDATSQYNFFYAKKFKELSNGTYQRKNKNTISVPYCADEIADCKYLMWQNPTYSTKWYYAFVTSINYENPKTTFISYQLDVYQTFLFDMVWEDSFIERQHTTRFNSGVPIVNTLDEGLDYGSKYQITSTVTVEQEQDVSFLILGVTKGQSTFIMGDVPSNLGYYIVPIYSGVNVAGVSFLIGNQLLSNAATILNDFRTNTSLVNSLVSAIIVPFLPLREFSLTKNAAQTQYTISAPALTSAQIGSTGHYAGIIDSTAIIPFSVYEVNKGSKWSGFPAYTESKLYMYPYSFIEMTTNRGDSLIVRPEYIYGDNLKIGVYGAVNFQNKMAFLVKGYLNNSDSYNIQNGLIDNSNENLPIVDDYTASYLQSNSNSLAVADSNAKLLQQNAIDNAQRTYSTEIGNVKTKFASETAQSVIKGGGSTLLAKSGLITKGAAANDIISSLNNFIGAAAEADISTATLDTNLANSLSTANVNYQTSVASNLAKIQDAEQVPPSTKSLGGNYIFDNAFKCNKLYLNYKTIYSEYSNKLTDYFKQYGYKVNKLETPNFFTRQSWNYIKMTEPNVYGNIPMDDLLAIKNIFRNGLTLWHGDYIGDYTRTNSELSGTFHIRAISNRPSCTQSITGSGYYAYGTSVTLTVVAKPDYHFAGWNDYNLENPRTIIVTGDATYTCDIDHDE